MSVNALIAADNSGDSLATEKNEDSFYPQLVSVGKEIRHKICGDR